MNVIETDVDGDLSEPSSGMQDVTLTSHPPRTKSLLVKCSRPCPLRDSGQISSQPATQAFLFGVLCLVAMTYPTAPGFHFRSQKP